MNLIKNAYPLIVILLIFSSGSAYAEAVGKVTSLFGTADYTRQGQPSKKISIGDIIEKQDIIRTKRNSRLEITFNDGSKITLAQRTRMIVENYITGEHANALFSVTRGKIRAFVTDTFSNRKESFRTRSKTAIAGVQGTDYEMHSSGLGTQVIVHKGLVSFQSLEPNIPLVQLLRSGESALIRASLPPIAIHQSSGLARSIKETEKSEHANNNLNSEINSGSMQDLIASGFQTQNPNSLTPQKNVLIILPPEPNLP